MLWRAWHGIWYGLAGMALYRVWSGGHSIVNGMAWWASNGIRTCLGGMAWYILVSGGVWHGMICRA